ncbi:MAG: HD domain-containing protein, partial [Campylobacterales bacterium]|nr:HD domain-containing protein [Campylobacterales bacterium]
LKTISDINELLVSSFSIKNIVENSVKRLIQQEEYSYVWIGLINEYNLEVVCEHKNGLDIIDELTYSLDKNYDDDIVFNLSKDSIDNDEIIIKQLQRTLNKKSWAITIPIKITLEDSTKEVLGNLCVFSKLEDGFLDEEIKMLEELAKDIAIALNSVLQQTKLKALELEKISNYEETILAFVNIIEQRDSYTAGHTIRVAEYCKLIAEAMEIDADDVVKIQKAAILHDIGKVVTPDSILLKPGKLMPLEYNLIKEHSSAGYEMLSKIKMYSDLAEIIKYHHSNYDGQGYPHVDKDKLDTIPILSHIMMIADAFDAMTSNRIYKSRKTIPEALEELRLNSGTQFHPEIVKVAIKVLADVTIQDTSQMPKNELEKRRFAYFFMDSLTDLYNEDYLKIEIAKNETKEKFFVMLELKRFSKYNENNGWKNGNLFLKEFATLLKKRYPNALIFRYRGDDFVLLFDKKIDILESEFINLPLLKDKNIDLSVRTLGFNGVVPDLFS